MNKYIEVIASVTAVQFWNTESCMSELKELGVNPINIRIKDGTPRLIITNTLIGEMEASEGDYIAALEDADGMMIVAPKQLFEEKYRVFEASEACDENTSEPETPAIDDPGNRLLISFPRPNALNELYAIGPADHNGIRNMYSIWRGNHSIMGMTGIIFQAGRAGAPDEQEGVKETDLLEIVYDRILQKLDVFAEAEEMLYASSAVQTAIKSILQYEKRCCSNDVEESD